MSIKLDHYLLYIWNLHHRGMVGMDFDMME
jgi:hypothetical protein